jgi:hypothetical protein
MITCVGVSMNSPATGWAAKRKPDSVQAKRSPGEDSPQNLSACLSPTVALRAVPFPERKGLLRRNYWNLPEHHTVLSIQPPPFTSQ